MEENSRQKEQYMQGTEASEYRLNDMAGVWGAWERVVDVVWRVCKKGLTQQACSAQTLHIPKERLVLDQLLGDNL